MANIMSQIKLRNKPSRNGFDLSKKNAFTAKVGELLPVYCKEVIPGDKFNISPKWMTRTQPVNTAAFTRIREYYDFFFVPTTLLWNRFGQFVTNQLTESQRADRISGVSSMQDKQPYFTVSQIVSYLQSAKDYNNDFGFNRCTLSTKLLHMLGYGDYSGVNSGQDNLLPRDNAELNPFPLLAYQKVYQDYFRSQQWERTSPEMCNVDYLTGNENTSTNIPVSSIIGASRNMFDLQYCNWNKDYFTGLLPSSQYGDAASVVTGDEDAWTSGNFYTPLLLAGTEEMLEGAASKKALFVGSSLGTTNNKYINRVDARTFNSATSTNSSVYSSNLELSLQKSQLADLAQALGVRSPFTILALRQAEAKQKWAEITNSQRRDYKSQVQAHFGVSMSDAYSDYCTYIGGMNSNIDISEVLNTNIVGGNEADIAGKGVGVGQGNISYQANTHGYIIGIYHAVPLLDYSMTGIKRQNLKTTFMDYAIPEFDATGMVQIPTVELTNSKVTNLGTNTMLGYAPRYIDYKTDIDEVHGAFTGSLGSWVAPLDDAYIKSYITAQNASTFNGLNYRFLKVSPSVLNPIFGADANSDVSTDQLLCNCYLDVKAVRNLDVNGLPY